jgi:hypothetical protein
MHPRPIKMSIHPRSEGITHFDLITSDEIAHVLSSLGFWTTCRQEIRTKDDWTFFGPYESGDAVAEELPPFAMICRVWAELHVDEDPVSGLEDEGATFKTGQPSMRFKIPAPEVSQTEFREVLSKMAELAEEAYQRGHALYIVT